MKNVNDVIKVTRFEEWKFWIDIWETKDKFESWITEKNYGISLHMFTVSKDNMNFTDFVSMIENNLEEQIVRYIEEKWTCWEE